MEIGPRIMCPRCGSLAHRSRVRWYERWFKGISARRPYRCGRCEHRLWMLPEGEEFSKASASGHLGVRVGEPELHSLDASLEGRSHSASHP
jgi:DNA-directed RNA polymerase subunit RPC12/RpoP